MTINALNSGAKVFMADFEDANTPLWDNMVQGQINLTDAIERQARLHLAGGQELHASRTTLATIVVRPRGWHLPEKHVLVDGEPMSGSLFDFGLYFFHNAQRQLDAGTARTSTCRRWRATSRRGCGTTCSSSPRTRSASPRGTHPRDRAHRDHPGGVRDGGDPLRAARALRRVSTPAAGTTCSASSRPSGPAARLPAARPQLA